MTQYIDKSALVAEIKRKIHNIDYEGLSDRNIGQKQSLYHILSFLNTLEVKEIGVDLGDPKGDVEVKTAWTDLEEVAIKYGNCFEKHSDLASMAFIKGAKWGKEQEEIQIKAQSMSLPHGCPKEKPISEELEDAANSCSSCIYLEEVLSDDDKEVLKERLVNTFKAGAKWQKENLWKPADGDDLPEVDREVIALVEENEHYKVVFAHRPPEYWDGKNILTGEVTRYEPKRYDKGGWNMPNIKYWLDLKLPKMAGGEV